MSYSYFSAAPDSLRLSGRRIIAMGNSRRRTGRSEQRLDSKPPESIEESRGDVPWESEFQKRLLLERADSPACGFEVATFYRAGQEGGSKNRRGRPRLVIGGDFYDVTIRDDQTLALVVGDVCGHGAIAAAQAVKVKAALRILWRQTASPTRVLSLLNNFLYAERESKPAAASPGDNAASVALHDFTGLSLAALDGTTGVARLAAAGMEAPLLLHSNASHGSVGVETIPVGGLALGIMPDMTYAARRCHIAPGELLVQMTDGLTEARPPGGEPFGTERIQRVLQAGRDGWGDAHQLGHYLMNALLDYCDGQPPDDMCLLIARRLPDAPSDKQGSSGS